jgi:hypothetical protein
MVQSGVGVKGHCGDAAGRGRAVGRGPEGEARGRASILALLVGLGAGAGVTLLGAEEGFPDGKTSSMGTFSPSVRVSLASFRMRVFGVGIRRLGESGKSGESGVHSTASGVLVGEGTGVGSGGEVG